MSIWGEGVKPMLKIIEPLQYFWTFLQRKVQNVQKMVGEGESRAGWTMSKTATQNYLTIDIPLLGTIEDITLSNINESHNLI